MSALVVDGVTKAFAGLTALDDVSLRLQPGEILGVMGPNGSGKTTLVNVISGVLRADAGRVEVDGRDVTRSNSLAVARAGVSRSFQTVRLFRGLSVRDNVQCVIRRPRAPVDRIVDELLDRLRIGRLASTTAGSLPYGLQRRVEIARALATEPRYLLLDEPAAGLNDAESQDLESIIRGVADDPRSPLGVLIIDHDIRMITGLCDRLHVLSSGRTIAEGPPGIVRSDPEVVRAYLGDRRVGDVVGDAAEEP
jgi:branched-chain amino acid transport system ATP-binding protein